MRMRACFFSSHYHLHQLRSSGNQTAVKDDVLPGGIKITAGTSINYLIYAMNRDPELWPDPLRFDPERFVRRPAANISMCGGENGVSGFLLFE